MGTTKDTVRTVWLTRLLRVGAVMEAGVGLTLLVNPSLVASLLLRSSLDDPGQAFARLGGGGLLALGVACWYARDTPLAPAGLGVARAFLVYNVVAAVALALVFAPLSNGGLLALGGAVLHGVLAAGLVAALIQHRS